MPPRAPSDPALAAALRDARTATERSQEAVAHDAGLTVGALARIERGETNPTWDTVRRVAKSLGITMAALGVAVDERTLREPRERPRSLPRSEF